MQLIDASQQSKTFDPNQLIFGRIKRTLEGLTNHVSIVKMQGKTAHFLVLLKEKKNSQTKLWAEWHVTIQQSINIQISLTDYHQIFVSPDPTINTADFLQKLNRESIFGTYFTNQDYPLICFRYVFGTQKNHKFVSAVFTETFWEVSEQFFKWVLKLKLVGGEQKCKSGKMFNCLKKLRYMKQFFQSERLNMPKSLKVYDLSYNNIKVVEEAMAIISYHTALLKNHKANELKKNQTLVQLYKKQYETLKNQMMAKQDPNVWNYIMRGIQISKIIDQKKIDEGGFSQIYRGEYIVGVVPTINSQVFRKALQDQPTTLLLQPSINDTNQLDSKLSRKLLVKKVLKSSIKEDDSFKNEVNLLKFIRSEKDPRIAGYYFIQKQPEKLYIEYYENTLMFACQNWSQKQLLTIAKQIVEGVSFLVNRKVLHRDLKELNILIDSQNHPKIIDFGSSSGIYQQNPTPGDYEAFSNSLMSTKSYYFPYKDIENDYPHIKKNFTRDQYNRAPTFDIFSLGTIIRNLFTLERCFDSIFYRQLCYLADKCQERNPEDRLTSTQVEVYIYVLSQLYRLENEETKKVSLKSIKNEKEGTFQNELFNTG